MNILVTGATGFLGSRAVERLLKEAWVDSILASGRSLKEHNTLTHAHLRYELGDLTEVSYVRRLFADPIEVVVHCAALSSPWGTYDQFYQANVIAQKNLVDAARDHSVDRFIFISTPTLYFNYQDRLAILESDPLPKPVNHYARTKLEAEELLKASGLPYVILRPRGLIGRWDTVIMPRLIRAHEEGRLKIIGTGKNRVDLTPVDSAAQAIVDSIRATGPALNQVYSISNDEPVDLWALIRKTLRKLGYEPPQTRVPFWLVRLVAYGMEQKSQLTAGRPEPALTQYGVGTLAKSYVMDITKAKRLLGYQPIQTVEQAAEEFVDWYQSTEHVGA